MHDLQPDKIQLTTPVLSTFYNYFTPINSGCRKERRMPIGPWSPTKAALPRWRPFMKPPYAIGSVPSLSGHAIAYRWRSLLRVRRYMASKPQGSSERVLPWQITMAHLTFASLSHTHYWYEVGLLNVAYLKKYPNVSKGRVLSSSQKVVVRRPQRRLFDFENSASTSFHF